MQGIEEYIRWVRLDKEMAPHSNTLVWKIPWTEEPGRPQSMGSLRVGHDWATSLSLSCIGEGNGNRLQCSCLENPRDGGALVGCRLWGCKESDTTEVTSQQQQQQRSLKKIGDIKGAFHTRMGKIKDRKSKDLREARVSLVAHMVKNTSAMWETGVQCLGWENPLEEGMATHPSTLAWRIPMDRGAWRATVRGVTNSQTWLRD